ncbi:endonuclease/exonuclease/phosphatase family protein [Reticulomyxa filosa]|uniref:Endonuclease/exonuclease/phosphatase family protein n=1 Tax=Reticulomyxa filosa TaxID=46433 RepID=X6MX76_RETFI|nr:endonuclease/exonuclease/phosphatase family protein [Reticulomyxa filosa]|eukprot:ETO17690.1 endonuclease/exonuclease/phosphatase family protein [Reticulomyxa filosa]
MRNAENDCQNYPPFSRTPTPKLNQFSILSWNCLYSSFVENEKQMYPNIKKESHRKWDYRRDRIRESIESAQADIVCLQEIDGNSFPTDFGEYFREEQKKSKEGMPFAYGSVVNSQKKEMSTAVLFNSEKFECIATDHRSRALILLLEMRQCCQSEDVSKEENKTVSVHCPQTLSMSQSSENSMGISEELYKQLEQIFGKCSEKKVNKQKIENQSNNEQSSLSSSQRQHKKFVLVCNCHLSSGYGTKNSDVVQVSEINSILHRILFHCFTQNLYIPNVSVVMCGDFNSDFNGVIYQTLIHKKFHLNLNFTECSKHNTENEIKLVLKHFWNFQDAYSLSSKKRRSTFRNLGEQCVLDFIFFSENCLKTIAVMDSLPMITYLLVPSLNGYHRLSYKVSITLIRGKLWIRTENIQQQKNSDNAYTIAICLRFILTGRLKDLFLCNDQFFLH